ncbi:MAG: hypothetical protein V4721_03725 [Bacteroidota bacterium]
MKKYILLASLVFAALLPLKSSAQINVNVNLGSQPLWGPVGYERAEYYYIPDIESYYHVPSRQFIYLNNNNWLFASNPPSRYSNYNLYNGYKVVLNSPKPYLNFTNHKVKYAKFKGAKGQSSIRYSNDPRYTQVIRGKKAYSAPVQFKKNNSGSSQKAQFSGGNGKGNGKGNSKGNKKY